MLLNLKRSHEDLLAGIAALERLCARPVADRAELAAVRWRLGQASSRRAKVLDATCAALEAGESESEQRAARHVRSRLAAGRAMSTRHVGEWTIDRILEDRTGYRAASADMRAHMRRQIAEEAKLLYPLLARQPTAEV